MELLVEVEEVFLAAVPGRASHASEQEVEVIDVLKLHDLAGAPDRHAFERLAQHQDLRLVLGRESPDDDLAAGADLDEAFLQKRAEGLSHRSARGTEGRCNLRLGKDAARWKLSAH